MTKILVIEDEDTIREEILDILEFEGYDAIGAEDGRAGVDLARLHHPDLILCDILMPELNGYGVLLALQVEPNTAAIPFLFLTAMADRSSVRKGMELGADDYLTKPFTNTELLAAIESRLERQTVVIHPYRHQLDKLRGAIIHTLPHELRTPLTGILGYTALLIENMAINDPDMNRRMLEAVYRSGKRLERLIENYLTYAQIEIIGLDEHSLQVRREYQQANPIQPAAMIEQVAKEKAVMVGRTDDLMLDLEDAIVYAIDDDVTKIIIELLDNAFKFSTAGSPVNVTARHYDSTYRIMIGDQGRGMSPEQVDNIDAMIQFDRKILEQQGLGIGLIVAKRLVELQGGTLFVESTPNEGTSVYVDLPA